MLKSLSIVFLCATQLVFEVSCNKLPATLTKCDRKTADFDKCLAKAAEDALRLLNNPIPELGLPSFNPLAIPPYSFQAGKTHFLMEQKYWDVKNYGFTDAKFLKFIIDFKTKNIIVECLIPKIDAEMQYDFDGILFGETIKAKGLFQFHYTNLLNKMTATFEEYEKNGQKHMKVTGQSNVVSSEKITYNVSSEDPAMGEHLTKVYTDNYKTIKEDTDHVYDRYWLNIFTDHFNKVLSIVPISELFGAE